MNTTNKKTIFVIDDALGGSTRDQFIFMANSLKNVLVIDNVNVLPNKEIVTFNKFKERYGSITSDRVGLIKSIQKVLKNPSSEVETFGEINEYFNSENIDGFCIDYDLSSGVNNVRICNALNFFKHFIKGKSFAQLPLLFYSSQFDEECPEFKELKKEIESSGLKFNDLYLVQNIDRKTTRTEDKLKEVFGSAVIGAKYSNPTKT